MQSKIRIFPISIISVIVSYMFFFGISIAHAAAPDPEAPDPAASAQDATTSTAGNEAVTHRRAHPVSTQAPVTKADITVTSAYVKPSIAGSNNTAAYISLHNAAQGALTIVGAVALSSDKPNASSIANRVEMHNIISDSEGVAKMVQISRLVVPAGGDLTMSSGGMHIMLLDLKKLLKEGDTITIDLLTNSIGRYQVTVPVKNQ